MTKIAVRQALLGLFVVSNFVLILASVYLLRDETTAALLFCLLIAAFVCTLAFTGLMVTAGSRDTMPFRLFFGYFLWASYRSVRFYTNSLWLILLLASLWLIGPNSIYRLQVRCEDAGSILASSFLGREVRVPCVSQRAKVQLYQPFRTIDVAKDRVSCLTTAGKVYPGISQAGPIVVCNTPPSRSPLRIDRMEPPVIEANRIRRYRIFGAGLSRSTAIELDAASFVGSSLSRDSDRLPAEVSPQGEWMDVFMSVMQVAGRDKVTIRLTDDHHQSTIFTAPIQLSLQR
jgi:hypothetical protein